MGDTNINGYAPALNAVYDDDGYIINLYAAGTVKAEKVWWGYNPPPTDRMIASGGSTLDYDPYAEYNPNWSYKAAGGKTEPSPSLLTPFVNAMREKAKGNYREAIQSFKLQIDSLPHTQEAIQALVKLKGLNSRDHYEEYDGDILRYLNTVTNTSPQLFVPTALVSAKILEGRGFYGDVIDIFDYLLSAKATTSESVLYQAFIFYLMRMGDISKAGELLSHMQGLDSADPVAVKCMMNDLEFEKDHVTAYRGELCKSGVYNIGKNTKSMIDAAAIPVQYNLRPAYPNPFNPRTTVSFDLAEAGLVEISVFNVLGQKIAILVNEPLFAGTHTKVWDASSFGSGIYFIRMHADNFTKTMKITLIK